MDSARDTCLDAGPLSSAFGGFGMASGSLDQQGHRPLDPWGQPTLGSLLREGQAPGQVSHMLQQQPLNWQQQQQPSYQQPSVVASQQVQSLTLSLDRRRKTLCLVCM